MLGGMTISRAESSAVRAAGSWRARQERVGGQGAGAARTTAALAALAGLTVVTGCGTARSGHGGHGASDVVGGCVTVVHGVVTGAGSLAAAWLPRGFRQQAGTQLGSSLPETSYVKAGRRADPPRVMLGSARQRGPLTAADGGRSAGVPVVIQGHRGFLESGPPDPQFIGVYWKPGPAYLVSVVGYKVAAPVVLRAARNVSFSAPGSISLPVAPGRIVSRQAAIAAAERAADAARWRRASAKLSSWTEIDALATHEIHVPAAPRVLTASPWRPAWAVSLTGPTAPPLVVVVDAPSGRAYLSLSSRGSWFSAITDRDPARSRPCPGGSTALLPFGVLTRNEQTYTADRPATRSAHTSVQLILSTVPAVNRADSGLYGGCVQQNCSIDQLVWVTIAIVRAAPGKTIACLPGDVSVPAGYKPKQVNQYYSVSVPDSLGIGCGKVPPSLSALHDLAPPAVTPARGG